MFFLTGICLALIYTDHCLLKIIYDKNKHIMQLLCDKTISYYSNQISLLQAKHESDLKNLNDENTRLRLYYEFEINKLKDENMITLRKTNDRLELINFIKKLVNDFSLQDEISFSSEQKINIVKPLDLISITSNDDDDINVYTDGSKFYNKLSGINKVGCSFIVYNNKNKIIKSSLFKLNDNISVIEAELTGIFLAIQYLVSKNTVNQKIKFYSDCQESIDILNSKEKNSRKITLLPEFCQLIKVLNQKNVRVTFQWIKGHSSIEQNELADNYAKDAANLPNTNFSKHICFFKN